MADLAERAATEDLLADETEAAVSSALAAASQAYASGGYDALRDSVAELEGLVDDYARARLEARGAARRAQRTTAHQTTRVRVKLDGRVIDDSRRPPLVMACAPRG